MNATSQSLNTLDPVSFRAIADLAYQESGLTLAEEKSSMIQSRLRHRLRDLGLNSFADYSSLLQSDEGQQERRHLISALTTNVSHFFRENHHYETLTEEIQKRLPSLRAGGAMRIWSAGSSNGQEAFSAAITALEAAPGIGDLNFRILGTDIDPEVVKFARAGVYPARLIAGVPENLVPKYFDKMGGDAGEPDYAVKPALQNMIQFNELNLLSTWPMTKKFDVIFCRNVVIYFDQQTQTQLWPRIRTVLAPDGVLFLGHSERISDPGNFGFDCTGPTTYRPQ